MISNPEITVYITNYNYAPFIEEAIQSVLNQTFQNFEIIIIDDGSTDNSKEIIEQFSNHEKITIIYQQNKGLNVTNNIALRVAKGKFIVRLDADDYLVPTMLEELVAPLIDNPGLGLVFPDYYLVDKDGNLLEETVRHNFDEEVQLLDLPAHGACTMIRIDFLKKIGGYDEQYKCQDGYELWIKFTHKYPVKNINTPLFYYRQHGDNLTSNEKRILNTRKEIKKNFVKNEKLILPKTLAVIPIRPQNISGVALEFQKIGDHTILERKINSILSSTSIQTVAVTSSSQEVALFLAEKYNSSDVVHINRPEDLGRHNVSLGETLKVILCNQRLRKSNYENLMVCSIEYPFVSPKYYDEAVYTQVIFKADGVISVRPDNSTFYRHDGDGMKSIMNQDQFTKLERESLYKATGGISLLKTKSLNSKQISSSKMSHIVIDQFAALGITNVEDLELLRIIFNHSHKLGLNE